MLVEYLCVRGLTVCCFSSRWCCSTDVFYVCGLSCNGPVRTMFQVLISWFNTHPQTTVHSGHQSSRVGVRGVVMTIGSAVLLCVAGSSLCYSYSLSVPRGSLSGSE